MRKTNIRSKLTPEHIKLIRERQPDGQYTKTQGYWARALQVSGETIRRARSGETFGWIHEGLEVQAHLDKPEEFIGTDKDIEASLERLRTLLEKEK